MQKDDLIELMIGLAVDALEEEGVEEPVQVNRDSPLLGSEAILNSMGLVTLITERRVDSRRRAPDRRDAG